MKFNLFMYCTTGRRDELEAGLAGLNNDYYQRMLAEIADIAQFADENGWHGLGHPEHHLQIEGFEASNDLGLMASWIANATAQLRVCLNNPQPPASGRTDFHARPHDRGTARNRNCSGIPTPMGRPTKDPTRPGSSRRLELRHRRRRI